jgi:hypothetical protein
MHYFFLAKVPGLEARTTLCNFAPTDDVPAPPESWAHVLWSDGRCWQFRALSRIPAGQALTVSEKDLAGIVPDDASPFLCIHPERLPETADSLPRSNHMDTQPLWRSNIQVVAPTTSASYQGEYPKAMLGIAVGTLLSIGPMHQRGPKVHTKLVLPNMRDDPRHGPATLKFIGLRSHALWGTAPVARNRVNVVDLDDLPCDPADPLTVVSDDITGVPLYLSHTDDFGQLSFEHTHPPVTMMVFGDRDRYQKHMKRWWLGRAAS